MINHAELNNIFSTTPYKYGTNPTALPAVLTQIKVSGIFASAEILADVIYFVFLAEKFVVALYFPVKVDFLVSKYGIKQVKEKK